MLHTKTHILKIIFPISLLAAIVVQSSYSWPADDVEEEQRKREALKQRVSTLLVTHENLAHLKEDSPLLDGQIYKFPDLVKGLIKQKADLEVQNSWGGTPLHIAILYNSLEGVQLLLAGGANPHHKIIDLCYEKTPLLRAIHEGNLEMVKALLRYGANANEIGKRFFSEISPLEQAISSSLNQLRMQKNRQHMVKLLLAHGADPEYRNSENLTVLQSLKAKYHCDVKDFFEYDHAWRHKGIAKMLLYYPEVKRIVAKISVGNTKLPADIVKYIMCYVLAAQDTLECPVCLDATIDVTTGCRHSFCDECITEWLKKNKDCPMCCAVLIKERPEIMLHNEMEWVD